MPRLTSDSHPLRIDAVTTPQGGVIGMTFCPGKKQPDSVSGHWDRDLDADLALAQAWGAEAVLTLMESDELARVAVGHLGEAVEALGIDWYHLPIRDVHPPGKRFENRWILYGLRARRILRRGGRVLLHCRGGLGRTGTVAARLLVELGMAPGEAITAVRRAHPGTIETAAQEAHVRAATRPDWDEAFVDRALGCLLGGALGDAFGYAVEFDSLAAIQRQYGPEGLREPVLHGGQLRVSDDTQMTLFTLEGLTRAADPYDMTTVLAAVSEAYADWLDTQGEQPAGYQVKGTLARRIALRHRRAPGNTCLSGLHADRGGTPEQPLNDSKGCGGVMRIAPLGWLTRAYRGPVYATASGAAALTHGHPGGWASAGLLGFIIWALFKGMPPREALDDGLPFVSGMLHHTDARAYRGELERQMHQAATLAVRLRNDPTRAIPELGAGWTGDEALAIALYAVLSARGFEDLVRRAANHDGDSDSTAAIAGQIWGAWKGVDALPMAWVRRLDVLAECLHGVAALAARGPAATATASMHRTRLAQPGER